MSVGRWRTASAVAAAVGVFTACGGAAAAAQQSTRVGSPATAEVTVAGLVKGVPLPATCAQAERSGARCYSPAVLRSAYGVDPLIAQGVTGQGETVVLPEAAITAATARELPPHEGMFVRQSLRAYDARFGLPRARLRIDTRLAPGVPADLAATSEELLDVEMVHAMAPGATIDVELVRGNPADHLAQVVNEGASHGRLMSISYGVAEHCLAARVPTIQAALAAAESRGVSVFASAGDELDMSKPCTPTLKSMYTGFRSLSLPASDPLVTAVGGTQLSVVPGTGAYAGETVWNQQAGPRDDPDGTGGGFSTLFAAPTYQAGVPGITTQRGVPDVAFSASPRDGVEVVTYYEGVACATRFPRTRAALLATEKLHCVRTLGAGGTSVGAPAWAGIGALADQYAHHPLGLLNPAIYKIGESPEYAQAFHDVTVGENSSVFRGTAIPGYSAAAGWDPVTGWGSPNASVLVPLLAQGG